LRIANHESKKKTTKNKNYTHRLDLVKSESFIRHT